MPALKIAWHEKHVQNLIKGMSQRQAYIDAHPIAKRWQGSTVDSKASDLLANGETGKIWERYQELQEQQKEAALLTRWEKRKILADIARETGFSPSDRTRAIDTDNKMENEYTTRVELGGQVEETARQIKELFIDAGG